MHSEKTSPGGLYLGGGGGGGECLGGQSAKKRREKRHFGQIIYLTAIKASLIKQ